MLLSEYIQHLQEMLVENGDHPMVYDNDEEFAMRDLPEYCPGDDQDPSAYVVDK